jgi:hypothetical protein
VTNPVLNEKELDLLTAALVDMFSGPEGAERLDAIVNAPKIKKEAPTYSKITTELEDGTEVYLIAPLDRNITWDELKAGTVTDVEQA